MFFSAPFHSLADGAGAPISTLGRHTLGFSISAGLFQRDIEFDKPLDKLGADAEDKAILTSFRPIVLKAQANIHDRINPFGIFGMADLRVDENDFEGTMKPFFGGGIALNLLDTLDAGPDIGLEAHSVYTFNDDDISVSSVSQDAKTGVDLNYLEIQAALFFHKRISNFIPFIGIVYSDTFFSELSGGGKKIGYGARTFPIGMFAGLDYFVTPNIYIHSELHNFVEDAIILGFGFDL